jgi:hypothetical protein
MEDTMVARLKIYNRQTNEALMIPVQRGPFAHGFNLASEAPSHSESQSSELASTWDKHENTKTGDSEEDLELHQLMEDIKCYIRSIDVSNL